MTDAHKLANMRRVAELRRSLKAIERELRELEQDGLPRDGRYNAGVAIHYLQNADRELADGLYECGVLEQVAL